MKYRKLPKNLMTAALMLLLGTGTATAVRAYQPYREPIEETLAAELQEEPETAAEPVTETEPEVTEAVWTPSPGELNLAHEFPPGADTSDPSASLAGEVFRVLMTRDEEWLSSISAYSDKKPETLAARLGKPRTAVMGKYDPNDEHHDPENPDTWTIHYFKNVRLMGRDGDGKPISPYSNVIEIMSLANVYTYYQNYADRDLFLSYAKKLWEQSHSVSYQLSEVYYCDGCLNGEDEQRRLAELEAGEESEEAGSQDDAHAERSGQEDAGVSETSCDAAAEETQAGGASGQTKVLVAGKSGAETGAESVSAEVSTEVSAEEERGETLSGEAESVQETAESAGVITAEAKMQPEAEPESISESEFESGESPAEAAELTEQDAAAASPSNGQARAAAVPEKQAGRKPAKALEHKCPGHVDLIVTVKITGMDETKNLFTLDTIGNAPEHTFDGGWQGWNEETMGYARSLAGQDWFEAYRLSVSMMAARNPLTQSEINGYLAELPDGLSETRRKLITTALESVGRVPYYWGGKPSASGYEGNRFGTLVPPDRKGRILKGLDCSGWISWVYWSATGERLPYESTAGLSAVGTPIARSELQPGDIIVRTGTEGHVIMFLGWTPDGRIRCIHESSDRVNNVTVSVRDANWPYYRKLAD